MTQSLAALLLLIATLTVSCRFDTQSTDTTTVKTDGGYQSAFDELPGYFVELMVKKQDNNATEVISNLPPAKTTAEALMAAYQGLCSGTHIGSGFILTAAHCITHLICNSNNKTDFKTELSSLGLKYNRNAGGTKQQTFQDGSAIEAVVFHHGYLELKAGLATPVPQHRYDLALIKTSGLAFADAALLPELNQHHLSASRLSGQDLIVYGSGRSGSAQLFRQKLATLGKDYFWGKVTGTTLDLQRLIDARTHTLVHSSPARITRIQNYLKDLPNLNQQPTPYSCINNYAYPPIFQHEGRTAYTLPQKLHPNLKELDKPLAARSSQILRAVIEHSATDESRGYGLHPASPNPAMVVTELMADNTPGRIRGICGGDSGGGLIESQGQTIVGVVSSTIDLTESELHDSACGDPMYLLFPSTYHHLNWLNAAKASILSGNHQPIAQPFQPTHAHAKLNNETSLDH